MGKSNAKKQRQCGYIKPHLAHIYDRERQPPQPGAVRSYERRLWCPGVATATAEAAHKHVWENDRDMPVMRGEDGKPYILFSPYDENPLWEGPLSCSCGKSKFLKEGRYKPKETVRFPRADPLERIMALREKLDTGGPEAIDEEDKAELEAIAADIIRILKPLMDQLHKMADMIVKMIQSFLGSLSPETVAYLAELGKSIGEKPDSVDTIELRDSMTGEVIATQLITPEPVHAAPATAILSDDEQNKTIEELSEQITGPAAISVLPKPGHSIVGGLVISLDDLPTPRAQRFGRASEY